MNYKKLVISVYPKARCERIHRQTLYFFEDNKLTSQNCYSYLIRSDGVSIMASSSFSCKDAWKWTWEHIERTMIEKLES